METDDEGLFGSGSDPLPSRQAENLKRTAKPVETLSQAGEKARKRRAARGGIDEDELKLSRGGLLGIPTVRNL